MCFLKVKNNSGFIEKLVGKIKTFSVLLMMGVLVGLIVWLNSIPLDEPLVALGGILPGVYPIPVFFIMALSLSALAVYFCCRD